VNIVPGPVAIKIFRPFGKIIDRDFIADLKEWAWTFRYIGSAVFFGLIWVVGVNMGELGHLGLEITPAFKESPAPVSMTTVGLPSPIQRRCKLCVPMLTFSSIERLFSARYAENNENVNNIATVIILKSILPPYQGFV
jgi:hypothetical protein